MSGGGCSSSDTATARVVLATAGAFAIATLALAGYVRSLRPVLGQEHVCTMLNGASLLFLYYVDRLVAALECRFSVLLAATGAVIWLFAPVAQCTSMYWQWQRSQEVLHQLQQDAPQPLAFTRILKRGRPRYVSYLWMVAGLLFVVMIIAIVATSDQICALHTGHGLTGLTVGLLFVLTPAVLALVRRFTPLLWLEFRPGFIMLYAAGLSTLILAVLLPTSAVVPLIADLGVSLAWIMFLLVVIWDRLLFWYRIRQVPKQNLQRDNPQHSCWDCCPGPRHRVLPAAAVPKHSLNWAHCRTAGMVLSNHQSSIMFGAYCCQRHVLQSYLFVRDYRDMVINGHRVWHRFDGDYTCRCSACSNGKLAAREGNQASSSTLQSVPRRSTPSSSADLSSSPPMAPGPAAARRSLTSAVSNISGRRISNVSGFPLSSNQSRRSSSRSADGIPFCAAVRSGQNFLDPRLHSSLIAMVERYFTLGSSLQVNVGRSVLDAVNSNMQLFLRDPTTHCEILFMELLNAYYTVMATLEPIACDFRVLNPTATRSDAKDILGVY